MSDLGIRTAAVIAWEMIVIDWSRGEVNFVFRDSRETIFADPEAQSR